jgi:hypothetical protein
MNSIVVRTFLSLCIVFSTFVFARAQTDGSARKYVAPFAVGETLTYEGKISKIIKGIAIADLTFTVFSARNGSDYLVKGEAKSKGTLLKLFRYSFLQQFETTIDDDQFRALKTVKHDVQKDRVRDSEADFDYTERRVTFIETDPTDSMRPPRKIASKIEDNTHDLVSGLYSLRLMPLAVGKSFHVELSDSGLVYSIPVRVTARERQKSIFGSVWCFRVEPQIFGPGRLIEQEGSMILWITDDARRIPVRSQVNSSIGRVEIKLKTAKTLK